MGLKVRKLSLYYAVVNLRIQKTPIYTRATLNIYHCGDDSGEVHLFSYRTQKLSSLAPTILCWRRHGKIGSCCIQKEKHQFLTGAFLFGRCDCNVIFPSDRYAIRGKNSQSFSRLYCFYGTYSCLRC